MAIVNLGTVVLPVGSPAVALSPFPFLRDQAYLVLLTIDVEFPGLLFSELLINPLLALDIGINIFHQTQFTLDPLISPRPLLLPMTNLYQSDGQCTIGIRRRNIIRGGGDAGNITVSALYDDASTVPTWLG